MNDAQELFHRWFIEPLKKLEELPDGDGGFVVLATSCYLYERYARAYLEASGQPANDNNLIRQLEHDFSVNHQTAEVFWKVIRDGLLHQGMPMQRSQKEKALPRWKFSHKHKAPIEFDSQGGPLLKVEPWLFRDTVLSLWEARPDLVDMNKSFPWATIEDNQDSDTNA